MEVKAVHVDDIDGVSFERAFNRFLKVSPDRDQDRFFENDARGKGNRDEPSGWPGPFASHYDRSVARVDEGLVKMSQDLFGATDRVGADGRKRKCDAEDRQGHGRVLSSCN
jgi:hypothetical protein